VNYGRGSGIIDTPPFRCHPNYCLYFALAKQSPPYASLRGNYLAFISFPLHEPSVHLPNFQLLSFDFLVSYPSSPTRFKRYKTVTV